MKRLWWWLLDELCAIAAENIEQGHYEVRYIDGLPHIFPRAMA